jgi:hypothetical protein
MIGRVAIIVALLASAANAGPIELSRGPHLFIDDYLIAESQNIRRVVCPPSRDVEHPNPIVTAKGDGCFQPYMTVLRDSKSNRFRIWYGAPATAASATASRLAYMESDDGINWIRPHRLLDTPAIQFGASILDEGETFADKGRRFKFAWWAPSATKGEPPGMKIASSPNGMAWTQMTTPGATSDVVLAHNHDINSIFRDPIRNRYVAIVSTYVTDPAWQGQRRVTCQSTSDDLLHWSALQRILVPDSKTEHEQTQFYAMDGFIVRGELLIGMVKVLRDDLKADDPPDPPDAYGIGYTTLAWTRDGEHWTRDRQPFFHRDPRKGAWDHAHAWIDEQLAVADDVYLYYGGYARGHKVNRFEERQIGLVMMKRDRYVARVADEKGGTITTPPLKLDADTITLTADARGGEIRVTLCDDAGAALPGFSFADCEPITADGLKLPVRFPSKLPGDRAVRIQFQLKNARLFAFDK